MLEEAPVGPNAGSSGGSRFQMLGGTGREKKDGGGRSTTAAFTGSGVVLGSSEQTSSSSRLPLLGGWKNSSNGDSSGTKSGDPLTDRREKARMAALARMNAQKNGSGSE